jgi:hypothetical protein
MSWLVVRAILGRALSFLGRLNLYQLGCIALALFAGVQTLRLAAETRHSHKVEAQLAKSDAARHADRLAYAKAQEAAQAKNKARVQQIETQQQKVTSDVESDYQRKLGILRSELRAQPAAPQGSAGKPGVSQVPDASSGPNQTSGMPLSDSERLRAAENELQLDELITWVEQQSQVDPNK